jgi:hypothetical protein
LCCCGQSKRRLRQLKGKAVPVDEWVTLYLPFACKAAFLASNAIVAVADLGRDGRSPLMMYSE